MPVAGRLNELADVVGQLSSSTLMRVVSVSRRVMMVDSKSSWRRVVRCLSATELFDGYAIVHLAETPPDFVKAAPAAKAAQAAQVADKAKKEELLDP